MAISGNEQAYLYARSGIARSGATRSNYVARLTTVDWIVRNPDGTVVSRTDLAATILRDSLHITQAINDVPDTCSFTLAPQDPIVSPQPGDEIRITSVPGGVVFHGNVITVQQDWRLNALQPPWVAVHCQDPLWRFDARMVTYQFPAQSVTQSIYDLVFYFCNHSTTATHPLDFSAQHVQTGMPSIPAFEVVNQRPSTVMRTLTQLVAGGFYVVGFEVHAWANSVSEPGQQNPADLIPENPHLVTFRQTSDASAVRRRELVEGRRTSTLIGYPTVAPSVSRGLGLPIQDASMFPTGAPTDPHLVRIGTQWIVAKQPVRVTATGANPPQTTTSAAFAVGGASLVLKALPAAVVPPAKGWIRVGNQYAHYGSISGTPTTDGWSLVLAAAGSPYGLLTVPMAVGETVEWVDALMSVEPHGLVWDAAGSTVITVGDLQLRAQPVETPVVVLAVAEVPFETWPHLEGFVQDGRYLYAGALARAQADLNAFAQPVVHREWTTTDPYAQPGRQQVISLLGSIFPGGGINAIVTILSVELTFPLPTLAPRRQCRGGTVQSATFLDVVLTETN